MPNVWIMNLRDNRNSGQNRNSEVKFQLCRTHGILAIGWGGGSSVGDSAYENAIKQLTAMRRGDLVWVRNPATGQRYLCEVSDDRVTDLPIAMHSYDIVQGRRCDEYYPVANSQIRPPLTWRRLIARSTIRSVTDPTLIQATISLFSSIATQNNTTNHSTKP